ncbi:hypothetical protein M8494_28740 [Serratia ureilytica]
MPLDGEQVRATGEVALNNNSLLIDRWTANCKSSAASFPLGQRQPAERPAVGYLVPGSRWRSTSPPGRRA